MKKCKVLLTIILLLAVFGTGFYFGWLQIKLGENDYGVVFTKMDGYDPQVLEPGKFIWRWENLIPTNLKLHILNIESRQNLVSISGELPSGEVYSSILESSPSFSYEFSFRINYRLRPDSLPALVQNGLLDPGNLETWYKQFEDSCTLEALSYLQEQADNSGFYGTTGMDLAAMEASLRDYLADKFIDIEFLSVLPVSITAPDLLLYQRAREEYFLLIETTRSLNEAAMKEAASRTMDQSANIRVLEEYGELLTKYPVLLEYLDKNPRFSEELLKSVLE